jgi:type VI secretion system secreted protein VgrG
MFEDAGGSEQLRMQAEKDMHKLVKNDETHTVGRDRTRHVKRSENVTVGSGQSLVVGGSQSVDVVGGRATVVGDTDTIDAGTSHTITVASGTGVSVVNNEVTVTTGTATIFVSGDDVSVNATGNLWLTAGGHLVLSGQTVHIDGGPMVKINCGKRKSPRLKKIAAARKPRKPGEPHREVGTNGSAPVLGAGSGSGAPVGLAAPKPKKRLPDLSGVVNDLPENPTVAPPKIDLGPETFKSLRESMGYPQKLGSNCMLIKEDSTNAMSVYQLAKGESPVSLPSTLQVFGPVIPPVPSFAHLRPQDLSDLVNVGNTAGIFTVGVGAAMTQFMALRTKAAPEIVDGALLEATARGLARPSSSQESAYALALQQQGVALYQGDDQGCFSRVDPLFSMQHMGDR